MNKSNTESTAPIPEGNPLVSYSSPASDTEQDINMPDVSTIDLGEEELAAPFSDVASSVNKDVVGTGTVNTTPNTIEGKFIYPLVRKINDDKITESNTNHSIIIDEEEDLVILYQRKINRLIKLQLNTDDITEVTRYRELINQFKATVSQLKDDPRKETNINKNTANKFNNKKIAIPYFQLLDDPSNTKTENRPSYDNAEMFVSTFEMILETNDVDVNKYWKKYLPEAFLFSKNDKHHRWYTNSINPVNENTPWIEIREKLIDRFGNSANTANNIEQYLDLKQGQQESIRDYVDRYLEIYRRLPINKQPSDSIEAMKFIKSLLPKAREEVTNSLKKNKHHEAETYLPTTLPHLFNYLEKNIGDIQEALYLAVTTPTNTSKYSNVEGFDKQKRSYNNNNGHHEQPMAKKFKDNRNLCIHCKKEQFSYEHLRSCVKYLQSEKYQQWLVKSAGKKETGNNKVIQIFYSETGKNINPFDNYSETYDLILEDYESLFEEFKPQNNIDRIKILNKNDIDNNNNNVSCYMVDGYSEKEWEELSPYSPFITVNNEKLVSMLDTGATVSMINKTYDFEDKTVFDNVIIPPGILSFVNKGSYTSRKGKTRPLEVKYRGREAFHHCFEIIEMNDAKIPILIGRDLINKLGIYIENIAYNFDEKKKLSMRIL